MAKRGRKSEKDKQREREELIAKQKLLGIEPTMIEEKEEKKVKKERVKVVKDKEKEKKKPKKDPKNIIKIVLPVVKEDQVDELVNEMHDSQVTQKNEMLSVTKEPAHKKTVFINNKVLPQKKRNGIGNKESTQKKKNLLQEKESIIRKNNLIDNKESTTQRKNILAEVKESTLTQRKNSLTESRGGTPRSSSLIHTKDIVARKNSLSESQVVTPKNNSLITNQIVNSKSNSLIGNKEVVSRKSSLVEARAPSLGKDISIKNKEVALRKNSLSENKDLVPTLRKNSLVGHKECTPTQRKSSLVQLKETVQRKHSSIENKDLIQRKSTVIESKESTLRKDNSIINKEVVTTVTQVSLQSGESYQRDLQKDQESELEIIEKEKEGQAILKKEQIKLKLQKELQEQIDNRANGLWHLTTNEVPLQLKTNLLQSVGIGEISEDEYTGTRKNKKYISIKEIELSKSLFHPHIQFKQLFQFQQLICSMIINLGKTLAIPTTSINRALYTFYRFYLFQASALDFSPKDIAITCVFLACKLEDTVHKLNDVLRSAISLLKKKYPKHSLGFKETIMDLTTQCLKLEKHLLAIINFSFLFVHPQNVLFSLVKIYNINREIGKLAWLLINESYKFEICLSFTPQTVAAGCIIISYYLNQKDMELYSKFYEKFFCRKQEIDEFCWHLLNNILLNDNIIKQSNNCNLINEENNNDNNNNNNLYSELIFSCLNQYSESVLVKLRDQFFTTKDETINLERDSKIKAWFLLNTEPKQNGIRFLF
ncbi:hypothetical protein K502DRAFT_343562 [Neoconidiobolus thromboides FSU 785]|nr:hypothetical protein K502DRAFT_343562 [Neoconidiobolus thromboides FSU 785]